MLRLTSNLTLAFAGDDVDGEIMRAGEQGEVVEGDGGQPGGIGAIERIRHVELVVTGVIFMAMLVLGIVVVGVLVVVVMVMLRLDGDLGLGDGAAGVRRQREHAERLLQVGLGLVDYRLLVIGRCRMLEADDVHAGHLQLHGNALVLDSDVQRAVAVHVRAEFAVLFLGTRGGRQQGHRGKGERNCELLAHGRAPRSVPLARAATGGGIAGGCGGLGIDG